MKSAATILSAAMRRAPSCGSTAIAVGSGSVHGTSSREWTCLRRAALRFQLHLPARRVASRGAGRAGAGAGLRGAGDHRRMLARRHRARACRSEKCSLPLIIGSEFRLDDGIALGAAGHRSRELRPALARSSPAAGAARCKGSYRLDARRSRPTASTAASRCGCQRASPIADEARWLATRFRGALWIAAERLLEADDAARCQKLTAHRRHRSGCPSSPPATCTCTRRERRALQDTLTAIRLKTSVARSRLRAASERRAPPATARDAATRLSRGVARRDARHRRTLSLFARQPALRISRGDRACRARRRPVICGG